MKKPSIMKSFQSLFFLTSVSAVLIVYVSGQESRTASEELGLRLSGPGELATNGRLEVFHNGEWGSVCDDGFDASDANVVCRTLGFGRAIRFSCCGRKGEGDAKSKIWLSNLACTGSEQHLFNCSKPSWGVHRCTHSEDVGVECAYTRPSKPALLPVRIFCPKKTPAGRCQQCNNTMLYDQYSCSSSVEVAGFVQAYYMGEWKFVDGSTWGEKESYVFCGNIGYPRNFDNPTTEELLGCGPDINDTCLSSELKKQLDNPIMYSLQCEGGETMLKDCFFTSWTSSTYSRGWQPGQYATVQCGFGPGQLCSSQRQQPLRLRSSSYPGRGRVEVWTGRIWGTICGHSFHTLNGNVICRQLGYGTAHSTYGSAVYGMGSGPISLRYLNCNGKEKGLKDCPKTSGYTTCEHKHDVGVQCHLPTTCSNENDRKVRMSVFAEMVQRHEYRFLQVEVEGEKGLVCGGEIHATVGQIMCREMEKSFFYYSQAANSRTFKGPRFVSTMECDGDELSTSQCSMSFVRRDSCNGTEITIYCTHQLPDLVLNRHLLYTSLWSYPYFERRRVQDLRCAIEDKCLPAGVKRYLRWPFSTNWGYARKLLRFDTFVQNLGRRSFTPYLPRNKWIFHQCHNHYHSHEAFVNYELFDEKGDLAAEGHKASFCLEDSRCLSGFHHYFSCLRHAQGVSVGCADHYARHLDCQWIDVTSVWKQRTYYLRITVNPNRLPRESDFRNNVVQCKLFFGENTFRLLDQCKNLDLER